MFFLLLQHFRSLHKKNKICLNFYCLTWQKLGDLLWKHMTGYAGSRDYTGTLSQEFCAGCEQIEVISNPHRILTRGSECVLQWDMFGIYCGVSTLFRDPAYSVIFCGKRQGCGSGTTGVESIGTHLTFLREVCFSSVNFLFKKKAVQCLTPPPRA